jgi:hypothetical protein
VPSTARLQFSERSQGCRLAAEVCYDRAVDEIFHVTCPYCGEEVEIYLEPDVSGRLVQDCEVCCNPWLLRIHSEDGDRTVDVSRADGSE